MGRVRLTGGSYSKQPFSKSKYPQKKALKREFFNVGGNLKVLANHAILYEKNPTGSLTGRTYHINLNSLRSKLSKQYKISEELEIICTLGICVNTENEVTNLYESSQEFFYQVSRVHYVMDCQKAKKQKIDKYEQKYNFSTNPNKLDFLHKDLESFDLDNQEIKSLKTHSHKVFEYIGNKEETEKKVSDYIQSCIGGEREVITPDGDRIDLLTANVLVEVKASTDWDNSVGQILKYKIYYPDHKAVIFLFDDGFNCKVAKSRLLQIIKKYINTDIYVVSSIAELQSISCRVR